MQNVVFPLIAPHSQCDWRLGLRYIIWTGTPCG